MNTIAIPSYQESLKKSNENSSQMFSVLANDVFNADAEELGKEHSTILKLQIGDKAPNFTLLNALSEPVNLYRVLKTKRVVLTFYRGTWCPCCNLILKHYQSALPQIEKAGATLIAISPQTPDETLNIKEKNALQFEVLSDNGNIVSKEFTTIHKNPIRSLAKLSELGYNYDSYYADEGSEIPIPAVFLIEQNGKISFAKTEGGDYRNRVESSDIINALNKK